MSGKELPSAQADYDGVDVEPVSLSQVWEQIEAVTSRAEITQALVDIVDLAGPADAAWRTELVKRYHTVRPFLPMLCQVIRFGASPEGQRVLAGEGRAGTPRDSLHVLDVLYDRDGGTSRR